MLVLEVPSTLCSPSQVDSCISATSGVLLPDVGRRGAGAVSPGGEAAVSFPLSPQAQWSGHGMLAPFLQLEIHLGLRLTAPSGGPRGPGYSPSPRVPPLSQSGNQHMPAQWHVSPALCVFGQHSAP